MQNFLLTNYKDRNSPFLVLALKTLVAHSTQYSSGYSIEPEYVNRIDVSNPGMKMLATYDLENNNWCCQNSTVLVSRSSHL